MVSLGKLPWVAGLVKNSIPAVSYVELSWIFKGGEEFRTMLKFHASPDYSCDYRRMLSAVAQLAAFPQ